MSKEKNGIEILDREVMRLHCFYQQNEKIDENQYWSGCVIREYDMDGTIEKHAVVSDIEGKIQEYKTIPINNMRFPEARYLFGVDGINRPEGTINFTIYPERGRPLGGPIDYMFKYDEEDDVFYGVWFFVNEKTKSSRYGGYARLEVTREINEYENTKNDITGSLWNLEAYYNNMDPITYMVNNRLSNLLPHEEVDNCTFESAKSYFRRNSKTLKLFYSSGE